MISIFKKLLRDRRGNALVIAAAAFPLVVGAAGLGTDTIQWTMWKRQLQKAADSAAIAGVYARAQSQDLGTAITKDLDNNNQLWVPLLAGFPLTTTPPDTPASAGGLTNQVQVDLAVQQRLGFSSLFLSDPPTITASARAALVPDANYCVVALNNTATPGVIVGGSANVSMGCGAISNSTHATASVNSNGSSYNFSADPVASVGGMPSTLNGASDLHPYSLPLADPYAGISTTPTSPCRPFSSYASGRSQRLTEGCYSSFSPGPGTWTLAPGTYYLNNTNLHLTGRTRLEGAGVTIILTGSSPGYLSMEGQSSMDISAPTTGPYANMLLIQSANATTGNNNSISGDNDSNFDGVIYFPRGDLTFNGTSALGTQCAMVVAWTVEFSGSTTMQNDTDDCEADTTVTGRRVRLVA